MKVCFVSHSAQRWGAEKALLELIGALRPLGVDPLVLLPEEGPLVSELSRREVPCEVLPYKLWIAPRRRPVMMAGRRALRTLWNLGAGVAMARRIERWGADLVYTNTILVSAGALAARLARRPHVWHLHEHLQFLLDRGLAPDLGRRRCLRLLDALSSLVIASSRSVAEAYRPHLRSARLRVVYQSVTIPAEPPPGGGARSPARTGFRCVMVGAIVRGKGHPDAIRALSMLRSAGEEAELWIIGEGGGPYRAELEGLIDREGLRAAVSFWGYLEEPVARIRESDALLMCSVNEAFGRVTVEAMLAGRPVIGARSGGTVELVRDGENGLLYPPGDPAQLAERILRLRRSPGLASRLGAEGLRWASGRFTPERYGREALQACREALGEAALSPVGAGP